MTGRIIMTLIAATLLAQGSGRASPILSEVFYDADGPDGPFAFTELFGCPGTILDGWSLVGVNGSSGESYRSVDLTGATIPLDGVLVVATESAEGDTLLARDFVGAVDWQNGPDAVELWNDLGERVDALQYGALAGMTLGEGQAAADAPPGLALTRDAWVTDTNDNALDFTVELPTPGLAGEGLPLPDPEPLPEPTPVPSPFPLPEPSPVTVLAGGVGMLLATRLSTSASNRERPAGRS